jgi:type I restriction enzyme S subunit
MVIKEGYKQTDIGLIPKDWEVKNLSDNFTIKARIGWQGLTTAEYLITGVYGLVTGTDFKNGYIDWDNCVYVERERFVQDKNIQLKICDVLVTKDGTIGKVAFVDKLPNPTTLNSGVFVLRPKNESINKRFFYCLLMSFYFDNFLAKITAGSTITHLYQKDFVNFNFILPSLAEQTAIATALSDADGLITSLEKLIAKKRNIKQGAMQQLLQPKIGWEVKKLGDICEIRKGKGISKSQIYADGKYKCILYGELFTTYSDVIQIVISKTNFEGSIPSKEGDILFPGSTTTTGIDLAKASTVLENGVLLGGDIIILRKQNYIYNSVFLTYFLNVIKRYEIAQRTKGITIHHLYGSDLASIKVEFPLIEEQIHISTILSDMDSELSALEQKLEKFKKVKLGMMQELLSGKTRLV